ncbi:MAG TPA: amidohydrolase family protein, partial [Dongiaceae bacterium]|nr:amidohydrolase family protein [Dongiaceae bacterium]
DGKEAADGRPVIIGPCSVMTGGSDPQVLDDGAVRVVGAHIAQIGPAGTLAAAYPEETVWPGHGRVLMPGLVNAHAHLARHLARGLDLADPFAWQRYDRALSAADLHWSAMAAMVEGVRHGVTTVCDFHRSGACLDLSLSEVVGAASRLGVRVATCYGSAELDTPLERRAALDESISFARDLHRRREGRLRGLIGVQTATLEGIERMLDEALAAAADRIAVHVDLMLDTTPAERWNPTSRWPATPHPVLWAHAERAPRALLAALGERGDAFSMTGAGAGGALAREVALGWGSDASVHAPPVFDGPPPAPAPRERGAAWAGGGPAALHYQRLFVNGHRWAARHFGEGLGRIESGAPADLVLVDYRPATELSSRTFLAHLVSGLMRAPVSGVMVSGEIVMDQGRFTQVDENEVVARARESAARIWSRM